MRRAELLIELFKPDKEIGALTKPEKLYLHNTNLIQALGKDNSEIGTQHETFLSKKTKYLHDIKIAKKGDFLVDGKYTFEIGGKGKTTKQVSGIENSYNVRDDMVVGSLNIIPLYLFGSCISIIR